MNEQGEVVNGQQGIEGLSLTMIASSQLLKDNVNMCNQLMNLREASFAGIF